MLVVRDGSRVGDADGINDDDDDNYDDYGDVYYFSDFYDGEEEREQDLEPDVGCCTTETLLYETKESSVALTDLCDHGHHGGDNDSGDNDGGDYGGGDDGGGDGSDDDNGGDDDGGGDGDNSNQSIRSIRGEDDDIYWRRVVGHADTILISRAGFLGIIISFERDGIKP